MTKYGIASSSYLLVTARQWSPTNSGSGSGSGSGGSGSGSGPAGTAAGPSSDGMLVVYRFDSESGLWIVSSQVIFGIFCALEYNVCFAMLTRHNIILLTRHSLEFAQTQSVSEPGQARHVAVGGQHKLLVPGADDTQVLGLEFDRFSPIVVCACLFKHNMMSCVCALEP